MPRGSRRKSARKSYRECDSDDSGPENDGGLGMFSSLLGFLIQQNAAPRRRTSAGRPSKRRKPTNDCQSHCHCCHCNKAASKKTCTAKKSKSSAKGKRSNIPVASTSTAKDVSIDIDSEDEVASTAVTETQAVNIQNKVDTFFKGLESEDEELGDKLKAEKSSVPTEKKSKDFYTLLSDSDDEKDKQKKDKVLDNSIDNPVATTSTSSFSDKPSTSGLIVSTFGPGLKVVTNSLNLNSEKKTEDLFAYVDDILNECNEIVDITDSKTKENVPVSLEDLKKRTDEILGGCASLMDDLNPKPKEPEKKAPESPTKEAPTCPICLEHLGGSRQAMATLCGHMFCEPCILQVVKSTKKCPSCRKGLTKTKYHPVYI